MGLRYAPVLLFVLSAIGLWHPGRSRAVEPEGISLQLYGRVGQSWTTSGVMVQGQSMNLNGMGPIGGRQEEGDWLKLKLTVPIMPKLVSEGCTLRTILSPTLSAPSGLYLSRSAGAETTPATLGVADAFIEATGCLGGGERIWVGARQTQPSNVRMTGYFAFDDMTGQGAGLMLGAWDVRLLTYFSSLSADVSQRRQRLRLTTTWTPVALEGLTLRLLSEVHLQPGLRIPEAKLYLPTDVGLVAGLKLSTRSKQYGELTASLRVGTGIANGADGGSAAPQNVYGEPDPVTGTYAHAMGVEEVLNGRIELHPALSLEGYLIERYARSGNLETSEQKLDLTAGGRLTWYVFKKLHLLVEGHLQGRQNGLAPWLTLAKVSIIPTLVPSGLRTTGARPHLRLVTTMAWYSPEALEQAASPFLETMGSKTALQGYLGLRAEWGTQD